MKSGLQTIFRVCLLLFILSILVLEFPGIRDLVDSPYSGMATRDLVVQNINKNSPNSGGGIVFGDKIYSVDGEVVRNYNHYRYITAKNETKRSQKYVFIRGQEKKEINVEYTAIPSNLVERKFKLLLVAFTFLLIGIFVYLRRADILGALFSLNCTIIAFFLTDRPVVPYPSLHLFGELFHDAVILVFPAVFLNFFLVFPDKYRPDGTSKDIRRMLRIYLAPLVLYIADCYLVLKHYFYSPDPAGIINVLLTVSTIYMAAYLVASLVIFVMNYRSSPKGQKLRLRIVISGTIVGILPFLFTIILRQVSPGASNNTLDLVSAVCLSFISVSFAYAILKHGAIDLHFVVKKSLVYAVLTGGIIAVYYALVNILGDYFTREFKLSQSIFSLISVLIIAIIFAPARGFFQKIVDRVFYMQEYTYKQEVVDFNKLVSRKLSKQEILDCFFDKVEQMLKPSYTAIYWFFKDEAFSLGSSSGGGSLPMELEGSSYLAKFFNRNHKSLMIEFIDRAWEKRNFDVHTSRFLSDSKARVVIRLSAHDSLLGLIVLGGKLSGRLYTKADIELLETFAEHMGLVLENAELHEESIEKARLKNEVMLARDIQLSLLPKIAPRLQSFDIVGKMMSSSEIGGDYYDYFSLSETRAGIALGDVSGNGIPAAMLVFSIQGVFKNLAIKEKLPPAEVNNQLNQYLCGNAKPDQFATFFYGILDSNSSTFTFSNAGQHPALLIKDGYVDRLGEGGMLLGVDPKHSYEEGSVRIESGDIICLHTDGIVEQRNLEGEEFGQDRLIEILKNSKNLPLAQEVESLFASVLAFGDGCQNDDLSCIIISNKKS